MNYNLEFLESALKEWKELDNSVKIQFKKKITERLKNPHISAAKLHGYDNIYKIKLKTAGYRLVYEVKDDRLVVIVLTVGRRDKNLVYEKLKNIRR